MQTNSFYSIGVFAILAFSFGMPEQGCSTTAQKTARVESKQVAKQNAKQCEAKVYLSEDDARCRNLQTKLNEVAATGDVEKIKTVFDEGANPNAAVDTTFPPINAVIASGNVEALKVFIDRGADVNLKTAQGDSPLKKAIGTKQPQMIATLIAHGAKP